MLLKIYTLDGKNRNPNEFLKLKNRNKSIKGVMFDAGKIENMV